MSLDEDEDDVNGPECSDSVMVSDFHSILQFGKLHWISSTAQAKLRYRKAFLGDGSKEMSTLSAGMRSSVLPGILMLSSSLSLISFTSSFIMSNNSSGVSIGLLGFPCVG